MKPKLYIVTGNKTKFEELALKLSEFFECEQRTIDEPEIQGTPEEIIRHKLTRAYELFGQAVLVDDVSLHFDELNGFPGPYIKYFWDHFTPQETGKKFKGTQMKVVCRLGLCRGANDTIITEGEVAGTIVEPKDNNHGGREFDLFLVADGTNKPLIEFSLEEKNEISHRGKAMKNLLKILRG